MVRVEPIDTTALTPAVQSSVATPTVLQAAMDPQQAIAMYVDIVLSLLDDRCL